MVNDLLDNERTYQDFPKHLFIQKLGNAFTRFKDRGDSCLFVYPGTCQSYSCSLGAKGRRFVGNHSGCHMDLIIEDEDGHVRDIFECNDFTAVTMHKSIKNRIFIDTTHLPPHWW